MLARRITRHEDELRAFIALLQAEGVRRYVEIGARDGNTFGKVMSSLPEGSVGVAVDLPGYAWGWPNSERALRSVCANLEKMGRETHVVIGDSSDPRVVGEVLGLGPYDAVFIDGDHAYTALKSDWDWYAPMGRIVALHDLYPPMRPDMAPIDVPKLWAEIAADPQVVRRKEIVGKSPGAGIGVVWRSETGTSSPPPPKKGDEHEGSQGLLQQRRKSPGPRRRKGA